MLEKAFNSDQKKNWYSLLGFEIFKTNTNDKNNINYYLINDLRKYPDSTK